MTRKPSAVIQSLVVAFFAWGASASAQDFTLTPPCAPGLCGAARVGVLATKPAGAIRETHYIEVDIAATELLRNSSEHIAISGFAQGQPFGPTGGFTSVAPNGGIGIALGRIDTAAHPSCPLDASDTKVEFAIEQFAWSDIYGSRILDCVSFDKSALTGVVLLRVSIFVECVGTTCSASASVLELGTIALLATVYDTGIPLANPNTVRRPWYAVTNFVAEPLNYSASFWRRAERYASYF